MIFFFLKGCGKSKILVKSVTYFPHQGPIWPSVETKPRVSLCFLPSKAKACVHLERLTTDRSNTTDTTTLGQTRDNTPGPEETGRGSEPFKARVALGPRLIVFQSWWPPLCSSWVPGGGKPGGKAFILGCSGFFLNPSLHGSGWSLIHVTEH